MDNFILEIYNHDGSWVRLANRAVSDFANFLQGAPEFSFGGGGVYNHNYRQKNSAVFVQDDWKATRDVTLNLGLRTEFFGAWSDNACHIGNIESDLTKSGEYPFVYPKCVDKLGVSGLTGDAAGINLQEQRLHWDWPAHWVCVGCFRTSQHDRSRRVRHLLRS